MTVFELFLIAVGLSMDAFAIAICKGLSVQQLKLKHMVITGLWFGGSQAVMPLIGYFLGSSFYSLIAGVDHWISFGLLLIIGINMIRESRELSCPVDASFSPRVMFPLAIADSIDALAVGVTFAFQEVSILPAVALIGLTTFLLSCAGVKIGNVFGSKFYSGSCLDATVIWVFELFHFRHVVRKFQQGVLQWQDLYTYTAVTAKARPAQQWVWP